MLFELPTNRTGVWFSGHMAENAGFFLGVPLGGPFFFGRSPEGGGGGLAGGASLAGPPVLGASASGVFGDVGIPSVARLGVVVLAWRACISWFHARWDSDHVLFTYNWVRNGASE